MKFLSHTLLISTFILLTNCLQANKDSHIVPTWQKICLVVGIILIFISGLIYFIRGRQMDVRRLLRQYIVPSQAEITFVDFKSPNQNAQQSVMQSAATNQIQLDSDNNYLAKQDYEQLSIDQGSQAENRNLSSVFQQKGSKNKKSKTRKRLANVAKVSNGNQEQNTQISQDGDL